MGIVNWTREFQDGITVYVIRLDGRDSGDVISAANTVFQLLPTLMPGEEIRIRQVNQPSERT